MPWSTCVQVIHNQRPTLYTFDQTSHLLDTNFTVFFMSNIINIIDQGLSTMTTPVVARKGSHFKFRGYVLQNYSIK